MRGKVLNVPAIPTAFWAESDTLDALASRDIGQVFRLVQRTTKASQTQIGIATGLSQAQVSEIMSGRRQVTTIDVLARIVVGLDIPEPVRTVLLLGDRSYIGTAHAALSPIEAVPQQGAPTQRPGPQCHDQCTMERFSDVTSIYPSRSEFTSEMPPHTWIDHAREVRAVGLSLNLLCQHYALNRLRQLINSGMVLRCLFLQPDGSAIKAREVEEGYPAGYLSSLTQLNIESLVHRVRDRLGSDQRANLEIATYDETIRFNIILVDGELCIAQPYLPHSRGVDSPTFVIRRRWPATGLYPVFDDVFDSLWERSRLL